MNKNFGIPNSKRLWTFRNRIYNLKYITAIWLSQFLTSYYQSGGNMNETMHAWLQNRFQWLLIITLGVKRIRVWHEIKKMAYNLMKCKQLCKLKPYDILEKRNTYFNPELNRKLYKLLSKYVNLEKMREELLYPNYGCGVIAFAKAVKNFEDLLKNFSIKKSIKRFSCLNSKDYETLVELIQQYEEDKELYSKYQDDDISKIGQNILRDLKNDKQLRQRWMKATNNRISKSKLYNFVESYWASDIDFASSDDGLSSSTEHDLITDLHGVDLPIAEPTEEEKSKYQFYDLFSKHHDNEEQNMNMMIDNEELDNIYDADIDDDIDMNTKQKNTKTQQVVEFSTHFIFSFYIFILYFHFVFSFCIFISYFHFVFSFSKYIVI